MSSTRNTDNAGADGGQERFLAKVTQTLDSSLTQLPGGIAVRLDNTRKEALLLARELSGEETEAARCLAAGLEEREQTITEPIRQRLDAIRGQAMRRARAAQVSANIAPKAHDRWWGRWMPRGLVMPASAFASVCMLVTTLAILNLPETPESMPLLVTENSLLFASEAELELYDNLEFYQWLADNEL